LHCHCLRTCRPPEYYEARIRALEAERQDAEGHAAEVDRYKQLLLKQRDIMIALTARLNERDERITNLQVGQAGGVDQARSQGCDVRCTLWLWARR
jgi:hypothetical protein